MTGVVRRRRLRFPAVPGPQRRFLLCLTALAALCVAAQAVTGVSELTLYMTPVFLITALLLSGRYVGEERIVARWRAAVAVLRRAAPPRHALAPEPGPGAPLAAPRRLLRSPRPAGRPRAGRLT